MKGLKLRRFTALILAVIMLTSLFVFEMPVSAADATQWEYFLEVQISDAKNSKSGNGNIFCNLFFNMEDKEQFGVPNTKKSGVLTSTTFTTTRAPWTLDKVQLENTNKDAFKILWMRLRVRRKNTNDAYTFVLGSADWPWYPCGEGSTDGFWIENEKGTGTPTTYTVYVSPEHKLTGVGNFMETMTGSLYVDVDSSGESDSYTEHKYNGRLSDQYEAALGNSYYCMDYSKPPTVKLSADGVKGNAKDSVNFKALTQSGAAKEINDGSGRLLGYSLNPKKLSEYMNKYDVNFITITARLEFDSGTVYCFSPFMGGRTYKSCDFTITRKAFSTNDPVMKQNGESPYYSSQNNYYYNKSADAIAVDIPLKTDGNCSHITSDSLNGAKLHYDSAVLELGNTGNSITLGAADVTLGSSVLSLSFPLEPGMTSGGDNVRVNLHGATLVPKGSSVTYRLWDADAGKMQYQRLASGYKVDTVAPEVTLASADGDSLSDVWRSTLEFTSFTSKVLNTDFSSGTYELQLIDPTDGKNEFFASDGTYTGTSLYVPAAINFQSVRKLWLSSVAEGSYQIKITGTDVAGNRLEKVYDNILLDHKAPVISVTETRGTERAADKSLSNVYNVSISDASGTGKLYYCFTKNQVLSEPAFDKDAALEQETGELETVFGRWAFIDQASAENGAAAILKIASGEKYVGRLYYFGIDAFGNQTSKSYLPITLDNEDTDCRVLYPESTAVPQPAYTISFETNAGNRVYWKWTGKDLRTDYRLWTPGDNIGSAAQTDANGNAVLLNGEYYLTYRVVTPGGTSKESTETFVFDNAAPEISAALTAGGVFDSTATVKITASDAIGIVSASAQVVTPDGKPVGEPYTLDFTGTSASATLSLAGLESGKYSLSVTAADAYGNQGMLDSEQVPVFYIRSEKPQVSGKISGATALYGELPLTNQRAYTISLDVKESFMNGEGAPSQHFYVRTADASAAFIQWQDLGLIGYQADENRYAGTFTLNTPIAALTEGENTIFVQSVLLPDGQIPDERLTTGVVTNEFTLLYDETAPTYRLSLRDEHTADTLSAKIYAFDNLEAGISLTCEDPSVQIAETVDESGAFTATFSESGVFLLTLADAAGNSIVFHVDVTGIDKQGPEIESAATTRISGEREDAEITVTVNSAAEQSLEWAVVPAAEAKTVFDAETLTLNPDIASVETQKTVSSVYDGETDGIYTVTVMGAQGDYVLAVRASDSVGNVTEFLSDVFTVQDAEPCVESFESSPKKTGARAKVRVKFNVPVKVLSPDRVTENDEDNFDAAQLLSAFSDTFSFVITQNGTYTLYAVDEVGREARFDVAIEDVTFGQLDNIKIYRYKDEDDFLSDKPVSDGAFIAANSMSKIALIPGDNERILPMDTENNQNNALTLNYELSEGDDEVGYTVLVYDVGMLYDSQNFVLPSDTERMIDLYSFTEGAERDTWDETIALAAYIDNTPPESEVVSVTPNIASEDDTPILTRSAITATFTISDPEVGLTKLFLRDFVAVLTGNELIIEPDPDNPDQTIVPGPYEYTFGESLEPQGEIEVPFIDKDGNGIDYSETPFVREYTDADGNVAVVVRVYGDDNIKGTKTVTLEFKRNAITFGVEAENTLGEMGFVMPIPGGYPEGLGVYNIRKLPTIGADDYTLSYEYVAEDGNRVSFDPTAPESADIWYGEAYVTLSPTQVGQNRGLTVTNNGRNASRKLTSDDPSFTFELCDAFGDSTSVDVSLDHFDILPGTISYTLSNTSKTAKPVGITVTATDKESGVDEVALFDKDGQPLPLPYDAENDVYTGKITSSGNYRLYMRDKAGNKTEKSLTISNINTTKPQAAVAYSFDQNKKSRENVTATLTFDKPNTRITAIDPDDSTDLSTITVNYGSAALRFTENGTVTVYYADEYGNEGDPVSVTVKSIYRTSPAITAKKIRVNAEKSEVTVGFEKALTAAGTPVDTERELWDLTVLYGGIAKRVQTLDQNGKVAEEAEFTFRDNGAYTFTVYDDEGSYAYLTVEISEIDSKAPVIQSFSWSYEYDVLENGSWLTKTEAGTLHIGTDTSGTEAGYILSTAGKTADDQKPVTNGDVTVTVKTDDPTRELGSNEEDYVTEAEKVYDDNGLYIFNREKNNRQTDSYGIDIEVIDKTPPVLLVASEELVFYENPDVGQPFSKELLTKPGTAFTAYDMFRGKTDLSDEVEITIDPRLNTDDFASNTFDRSIAYTVTYTVSDRAHNVTEVRRTVRLVGMYDTVVLVNGELPDAGGRAESTDGKFEISLANFSGIAYVRYAPGLKTMGEMKQTGTMLSPSENGSYVQDGLAAGWYTVFVQTDKRDYITLQIYINN